MTENKKIPKIVVTVEGGNVSGVYSSEEVSTIIVDYDNLSDVPVLIEGPQPQDSLFKDGEASKLFINPHYAISEVDKLVIDHLEKHKF